jgi:hypothetical protein
MKIIFTLLAVVALGAFSANAATITTIGDTTVYIGYNTGVALTDAAVSQGQFLASIGGVADDTITFSGLPIGAITGLTVAQTGATNTGTSVSTFGGVTTSPSEVQIFASGSATSGFNTTGGAGTSGWFLQQENKTGGASVPFGHSYDSTEGLIAWGAYITGVNGFGAESSTVQVNWTDTLGAQIYDIPLQSVGGAVFVGLVFHDIPVSTVSVTSIAGSDRFGVDDVLLAKVPEPGTILLSGLGFLLLGWVGMRRRKAQR